MMETLNVKELLLYNFVHIITMEKLIYKIPSLYKIRSQFSANLLTFTEEILNGKVHFLYSGWSEMDQVEQTVHKLPFTGDLKINILNIFRNL